MAQSLSDKERAFIAISSGDGSGYGYGYGYGSGSGSGSGSGYGYGSGYGDGDGSGEGDGSGYGSGSGSGYGYGYGSGYGSGYGDGDGDGSGYGSGSGDGDGDGVDITTFASSNVVMIDGVQTILKNIHGNVARANILQRDLTLTPCYVVKRDNMFAHGDTIENAMAALMDKVLQNMPAEERVEKFLEAVKPGVKYPAQAFFDWHHRLTGSCEAGRKAFAADHGIDLENGEYTMQEFLELTKDAYGSDVIRMVIKKMEGATL